MSSRLPVRSARLFGPNRASGPDANQHSGGSVQFRPRRSGSDAGRQREAVFSGLQS